MEKSEKKTLKSCTQLRGEVSVPGDKSISHRALMFASLARGTSQISGLLQGEDCHATLNAFRALGVRIDTQDSTRLRVQGVGLDGLKEPANIIDCGNSGTTMRLISGILAAQPFFSVLTGDQYLRKRPMRRIVEPLTQMGARIYGRDQHNRAPLAIVGGTLKPIDYSSAIASAQVKSAVLLAGMQTHGTTTVYEPHMSRDHSERMLRYFGVPLESFPGGARVTGPVTLEGRDLVVPGDISSAAFFLVAGLIVPNSELLLKNVGINPTRSGIIDILRQMGGSIELLNEREQCGEPVADLLVKSSSLTGIEINGELVPRAIDEFPVISVAATFAAGVTVITDAAELRVKETDRIEAVCHCLNQLGGRAESLADGMRITGTGHLAGGKVTSYGDHRIAMSMAIASLRAAGEMTIDDTACTATSFPGFWDLLNLIRQD